MSKLVFYYSGMNAGKSAHLLQKSHNVESKGFGVERFTMFLDKRFGDGKIASRIGIEAPATLFNKQTEFKRHITDSCEYIFVDEAQFLTQEQVLELTELVDKQNVQIFCYGLRTDFQGTPFQGSIYLMAWADEINEIESYDRNGMKAMMNMRLNDSGRVWHGAQTQIGLNYESIHRKEFELRKALFPQGA